MTTAGTSGAVPEPTVPQDLSLEDLRTKFIDAVRVLNEVADPARPGTHAEGGDVATWGSPRTAQRHFVHYFLAGEFARVAGLEPDGVIDAGCGTGAFSRWLADDLGARLYLYDHDPNVLAAAVQRMPVDGVSVDLGELPRTRLITAMEVIEHVPYHRQPGFVRGLYEHLLPGGWLVFSTPDETGYPGGSSGYPPHIGCLRASEFGELVRDATGRPVMLWRIEGGPFTTSRARMWFEVIGNRTVAALPQRLLSSLNAAASRRQPLDAAADGALGEVKLNPITGRGDGMMAAVGRPA